MEHFDHLVRSEREAAQRDADGKAERAAQQDADRTAERVHAAEFARKLRMVGSPGMETFEVGAWTPRAFRQPVWRSSGSTLTGWTVPVSRGFGDNHSIVEVFVTSDGKIVRLLRAVDRRPGGTHYPDRYFAGNLDGAEVNASARKPRGQSIVGTEDAVDLVVADTDPWSQTLAKAYLRFVDAAL